VFLNNTEQDTAAYMIKCFLYIQSCIKLEDFIIFVLKAAHSTEQYRLPYLGLDDVEIFLNQKLTKRPIKLHCSIN
jgi:hypothetical protein